MSEIKMFIDPLGLMIPNEIMLVWNQLVYLKVLVRIYLYLINQESYYRISEGRERPEWLDEYESELDDAIASLRGAAGGKS
jgi:hypothetical protein